MAKLKKVEFTGTGVLSEKAFEIYSNSSITFYEDEKGTYYAGENSMEEPFEVGDMEQLEAFLSSFDKPEE